MTQKRLLLFQTFLEALIPILGYFYWDWGLPFILLFYALDWILAIALNYFKCRKRLAFSLDENERRFFLKDYPITTLVHLIALALFGIGVLNWNHQLILKNVIYDFMSYTEMGIPQGLVLVPLMVFAGYTQFRQQFLFAARFRTQNIQQILSPFRQQGFVLTAFSGVFLGSTYLIVLPELLLIAISITGISLYRWRFLR